MPNIQQNSGEQVAWLSILRAWAVLLVIILHSTLPEEKNGLIGSFFFYFNDVFSCRMPLFFFISGFLLFYTKIRKDSGYVDILKKRVPRVLYPYLFVTLAVFCVKVLLNFYESKPVNVSFLDFLGYFIYPQTNLWTYLWFLNVLLIYLFLYPLVKKSLNTWHGIVTGSAVALLLAIFFPKDISLLGLSKVMQHFIFFYVGILFAKFDLISYLKQYALLICGGSIALFAVSYLLHVGIVCNLLGIVLCIYFSLFCAKKYPAIFSGFRQYYYQIYLFGTIFQHIIEQQLYLRTSNVGLSVFLSMFSVVVGIYMPVFIGKLIKKINWKPLLKVTGF